MIVTELSSSQEDSEGCVEGEVIEPENQVNFDNLNKSLGYYLEEEDGNGNYNKSILDSLLTTRFSKSEVDSEEIFSLEDQEPTNEFSVKSFTKTFKTLVDIATEPIIIESPTISSGNSEESDSESFSIIPAIKRISNKFIKKTSIFFKSDTADLISLNSEGYYENPNEQVIKLDLRDEEEDEGDDELAPNSPSKVEEPQEPTIKAHSKNWNINELTKWF